jgi:hypothetical protein
MKRTDLTGLVFGRLTVVADAAGPNWRCMCACGGEKVVSSKALNSGKTSSCGCLARDVLVARNRSHGWSKTQTYRSWKDMRARCNNQNDSDFKDYGGRGIEVCGRWADFGAFLADMGERPAGRTIDRIDTNGNYEPGNCRWADAGTQANNKRSNRIIEWDGKSQTLQQWCRQYGLEHSKVSYRIRQGFPIADAFSLVDFRR